LVPESVGIHAAGDILRDPNYPPVFELGLPLALVSRFSKL